MRAVRTREERAGAPRGMRRKFRTVGTALPRLAHSFADERNALHTTDINIPVYGTPMPCYLARPEGRDLPGGDRASGDLGVIHRDEVDHRPRGECGVRWTCDPLLLSHPPKSGRSLQRRRAQDRICGCGRAAQNHFMRDLAASYDWLNAQDYVRFYHIATWGFCMAGRSRSSPRPCAGWPVRSRSTAARSPGVPGGRGESLQDADEVRAPLLLVYGGQDQHIPAADSKRSKAYFTAG